MKIDWQLLFKERKSAEKTFGSIWQLPIKKRYHQVLAEHGQQGTRLLEIGAGDKALRQTMTKYWQEFEYRSCDIDPTHDHDFSSSAEIEGEYDLIAGFEIIEHVSLEDAAKIISDCFDHLKPGGMLVLTTPNTFYPPAFLRDATHITPFCYDELAGLTAICGFRPKEIYRLYHDSLLKKFIRRVLLYPFFRGLGIDFAHQIAVVSEKPA